MNIAVCARQVVDTETRFELDPPSWRLHRRVSRVLDPQGVYMVEEALRIRGAHGGEVTAVRSGPKTATDAGRKAVAMWADEAALVSDLALATVGSTTRGIGR